MTPFISDRVSSQLLPGNDSLIQAWADGLRFWSMPGRLLEMGCAQVRRNLSWEEWQIYLKNEPYRQTCPDLPVHYSVSPE